jgi:hypothetical protein
MSSTITNLTNRLPLAKYSSNTQSLILSAERQIEQIDRRIANNDEQNTIRRQIIANNDKIISNNDKLIANNDKLIANNDKLITALKESRDLRENYINTLKEHRNLQAEARDITAQLLACYEKLVEIVRAKTNQENPVMKTYQNDKDHNLDFTIKPNKNSVGQQIAKIPTTQVSRSVDMVTINADATQKLGDLLFDRYKGVDFITATNLRERFFQHLGYNATKKIASNNSNLKTIFETFMEYLKQGEYNFKNPKSYFSDIQARLMQFDKWC